MDIRPDHARSDAPGFPPGSGCSLKEGPGVPPRNHAQDARATFKLYHYLSTAPARHFA